MEDYEREAKVQESNQKMAIFAGNPQLYLDLFGNESQEEDIDWVTPRSPEEIEQIIGELSHIPQQSGERF